MKRITAWFLVFVLFLSACGAPAVQTAPEKPSAETELPETPAEPAEPETPAEPAEPVFVPGTLEYTAPAQRREVKNILLIGNSFSYSLVEELYALGKAAGYELNVCNLYKAGCTVMEHWNWLVDKERGQGKYGFWVTNSNGWNKVLVDTSIDEALAYAEWDVITLQQHFDPKTAKIFAVAKNSCTPYVQNLFDYLKENFPAADLFWYETWAYEVGHRDVRKPDVQTNQHHNIQQVSWELCWENDVPMIPAGDAWQLARQDRMIGDTLCKDDKAHDGDVGGGQYLNACVFFEVLFGKSCVGSTWRPDYALPEAKIPGLQQAAHEAVAAVYGEDYAK